MYSIPPERLGDATRRQLYRTLHEAQEQVRRAGHALHDEYQHDQSRALYDLANRLGDIKALYEPRRTDVLELGRRRAEFVAATVDRLCIYTDDGGDPTADHPACGEPATVQNPNHPDEWYCRKHGDPSWA